MSELIDSDNNQNTTPAEGEQQIQAEQETFLTYNGREFKSKDDVVKKFEHADSYIEEAKQREQEYQQRLAELEAKLEQATKLETAMEQLKNQQGQQAQGENTTQPQQNVEPKFDEDSLLQKFEQRQAEMQRKQQEEANLREIHEAAKSRLGDGYLDKLVSKAQEDGLDFTTKEELVELARTRPKTFQKLFGLTSEKKPQPAPTGGIRTSPEPNRSESRSWEDIARDVAKANGVEWSKGFHSSR